MPSNALSAHLAQLLMDATELGRIHAQLRTGQRGRQYGLASLNRAAVVIAVSAWEAYVEELAQDLLNEALALRHQIAHGVNPRPVIHNTYSNRLLSFVRRLAECTDNAVRNHFISSHGLMDPWPA